MCRTKIIATIGPASLSPVVLRSLVKEGMDVARLNTAFGDLEQYRLVINRLRVIKRTIPIVLDLKGEELRLHLEKPIKVSRGKTLNLGFSSQVAVWLNRDIRAFVHPEQEIRIDNGLLSARVEKSGSNGLEIRFSNSGILTDNRHVNLPGVVLPFDVLSAKDYKLIQWAKRNGVDWLAVSFVSNEEDIARTRRAAGSGMHIIAKIENARGVENYEEIIRAADGVMVARGDLAAEIGYARVPIVQKQIIAACNAHGRMDIVATEMLESLLTRPTPARSDVSDVANAVLDGADYLMLTNETAVGKYPVKAVKVMREIIEETERSM